MTKYKLYSDCGNGETIEFTFENGYGPAVVRHYYYFLLANSFSETTVLESFKDIVAEFEDRTPTEASHE